MWHVCVAASYNDLHVLVGDHYGSLPFATFFISLQSFVKPSSSLHNPLHLVHPPVTPFDSMHEVAPPPTYPRPFPPPTPPYFRAVHASSALCALQMFMGARANGVSGPFFLEGGLQLPSQILSLRVYNKPTVSTISRPCLLVADHVYRLQAALR